MFVDNSLNSLLIIKVIIISCRKRIRIKCPYRCEVVALFRIELNLLRARLKNLNPFTVYNVEHKKYINYQFMINVQKPSGAP